MTCPRTNIYTIEAGEPFARRLAAHLLEKTKNKPEELSKIKILLPTRRACRVLREAFLVESEGKALLLPRMMPIGDIDEEELNFSIAGTLGQDAALKLPPAIPTLQRKILLAKLIAARPDFTQGIDYAIELASELGKLMDQIYTEDLKLENLKALVPNDFSEHWQVTLEFLEIIAEHWPNILEERGFIDVALCRNLLIKALADFWEENPPESYIIAAGTTGSIPATARLLKVISTLPHGEIILPGLDLGIDEADWKALNETHPQYGLRELLSSLGLNEHPATYVKPIGAALEISNARRCLVSELMRPAETSKHWTLLGKKPDTKTRIKEALKNLNLIECDNEHEEAGIIALALRETLEDPKKKAVLVTPDRTLAQRVAMECRRWSITLDDSAGQPLYTTPIGTFLRLCLEAIKEDLAPVPLLAMLKHSFAKAGLKHAAYQKGVSALERILLRGKRPRPGLEGLHARVEKIKNKSYKTHRHINAEDIEETERFLKIIDPILQRFIDGSQTSNRLDFNTILMGHLRFAEEMASEALSTSPQEEKAQQAHNLWQDNAGEAAAQLFTDLIEYCHEMPDITLEEYASILEGLMRGITVRPAYGTHPRLMILGQLEARLIDADVVIMGGLNEGTWPPDGGHDPWMSRPMRADFGLPLPEKGIGLSAHDFVQAFCSPHTIMTRAKRVDGAPTRPARWLKRLETVLNALNINSNTIRSDQYVKWLKQNLYIDEFSPCKRPEPRPERLMRPRELSVTQIETWVQDPYSIYAKKILDLPVLDPIDQNADAALRGTIIHETLEEFTKRYPLNIPENAVDELQKIALETLKNYDEEPESWTFWWPRFTRLASWYVDHEHEWQSKGNRTLKIEAKGQINISENIDSKESFVLKGRADRIDSLANGGAAIIDYKSGGTYALSSMQDGRLPQLPLEALILSEGGFKDLPSYDVNVLAYWILTGSTDAGKITSLDNEKADISELIKETRARLTTLINLYDDENTPYYAVPNAENMPRFNDYEHLARIREWSITSDNDGEAA